MMDYMTIPTVDWVCPARPVVAVERLGSITAVGKKRVSQICLIRASPANRLGRNHAARASGTEATQQATPLDNLPGNVTASAAGRERRREMPKQSLPQHGRR